MPLLQEGAEYQGESGKTYLAVTALGQHNVFTGVEKDAHSNIVVLKAPAADDTGSWPLFQHEMIMHELLKNCDSIRKQVDRIPPSRDFDTPPILVLEMFETTLWQARTKRPFTKGEVRSVARQILKGLKGIHSHGLVYADLKMQNVMLNGFDVKTPGDGSNLEVKLGDLGIVMQPAHGTVQPVAYRAPEVFFKGEIAPAIDMWAFGLVYCHLLEAMDNFSKTGLYDDLYVGSGSMREREQAMRNAIGNDFDLQNEEYYRHCALPYNDPGHPAGQQWDELRKRGLDEEDVEFLQQILTSDPRRRASAADALDMKVMNGEASEHTLEPIDERRDTKHDLAQVDGPSEARKGSDGNLMGSAQRLRRPADSQDRGTPGSVSMPIYRPESLMRGVSQAIWTPALETNGVQTPGLFRDDEEKERMSPVREHPLVQSAESAGESQAKQLSTPPKTTVGGEAGMKRQHSDDEQPPRLKNSDFMAQFMAEPGTTSTAQELNVTAESNGSKLDPARPEYLGRNSSNGGTFLSYR